ncbi:MAG: DUF5131 family protein [Halothece sp.]
MASNIQWTDETWNPIVGCSRISSGCANCYAAEAAKSPRLQQFSQYQTVKEWNGITEFVQSQLLKPLSWRSPKKIFVCSMSDLFHENTPFEWINKVFAVMALCPQHTFQVLTKRPERMLEYFTETPNLDTIISTSRLSMHHVQARFPLPNVWLGTTCENQAMVDKRVPLLSQVPAVVRFLSCEPLLSPINLSAHLAIEWSEIAEDWIEAWPGQQCYSQKIQWVIIGGESGQNARPCHLDWMRSLVNQCQQAQIPVFIKQLGSHPINSKPYIDGMTNTHYPLKLKDRKGGNIEEWPDQLRVREFPNE